MQVLMYCTRFCAYCTRAERLLLQKGVPPEKIYLDDDPDGFLLMIERTGRRTVPQIYIGDFHVGGYDDLAALERAGKLDLLLTGSPP